MINDFTNNNNYLEDTQNKDYSTKNKKKIKLEDNLIVNEYNLEFAISMITEIVKKKVIC